MNTNPLTHYELVASAFSVIEIAQPITTSVLPDLPLQEVFEHIMEIPLLDEEWFYLVRDDHHIYGYFTFDDEAFYDPPLVGTAKEKASPITPDMIVPASLPLIEMIPLFEQYYYYFVLTRNDITHVVSFQDIDKLPTKLCLFSLFMELESQIIDLLHSDLDSIDKFLNRLPEERLKKARDLCQMKYKNRELTSDMVLLCTTFIDKKEILQRSPEFHSKLPFQSKQQSSSFFKRVEIVRNQIAHSDSILSILKTPKEMNYFITDLRRVIASITNMKQHGNREEVSRRFK